MVRSTLAKTTKTGITAIMAGAMLTGSSIAYAQNADPAGDPAASTPAPPVTSAPEAAASSENPVDPLYGNINPFYGNISPFWGTINPFYGNIEPFWGTINPFYGNITPFWGTINPFTQDANSVAPAWGTIQPFWESVGQRWNTASTKMDRGQFWSAAQDLKAIAAESESIWGDAVTSATGQSFADAFLNPLYAKYGIDPNQHGSLASLSEGDRAQFFMDWFDGLMNFSGTDRVDHWMHTANWAPSITQQQGSGEHTVIGILDANISGDIDLEDNIIAQTGFKSNVSGHGIGVASLIVAAHDGAGVMGIAPNAKVALHNPFDHTGTTNWNDVRNGINALKVRGASVINMSLGAPGYTFAPEWVDVFGHVSTEWHRDNTAYVLAAGNDGVTQTQDVEWGSAQGTNFLVVGSVAPDGNISTFSNRPGEACLLVNGSCNGGDYLKNNFVVAPGELLLVSDGQGGTVRRTGTSFAAPLVSGAIALLHDRWPWLANNPETSIEIIKRSAQDLGEEGVDGVYGHGLLDITASQSPLDFGSNLRFFEERNGSYVEHSAASLQAAGIQSTWETDEVHFVLYEYVGTSVRDFAVPLSSLVSGSMTTYYGAQQQYQNFLTQGLTDFISGGNSGSGNDSGGLLGFTDVAQYTTPDRGGWQMSIAAASPAAYLTGETGDVPHSAIRAAAPGSKLGFTAGHGYGAMALTSEGGFGLSTDYATDGGVNPLLALASGGSFFATDYSLSKATKVSLGYTSRDEAAIDNPVYRDTSRLALLGRENYKAGAMNLRVTHQASKNVSLSVNYTRLREDNALLAVQGENGLLRDGSNSETLTFSGTAQLPEKITVSASATAGRTKTAGSDQILSTSNGGVMTSAFALTATKNSVLGSRDRLRLSVSQPMHIERGELQLASAEIVDRATGEIGTVNRSFGIDQNKRLITGEMIYAAPLAGDAGEVSFFGRATMGDETDERSGIVAGARLSLQF